MKKLVVEKGVATVKETKLAKTEGNSPADLIRTAVAGGADLDKLEKLLNLQERYEANEARKSYHVAMAAFKENPPKIEKDKKVSYLQVKYNHASLANVTEQIGSALSKQGLSASWSTKQNGVIMVTCKITHVKGHSEETTLSAPSDTSGSKNAIQAIGSTITYLERYTLLALTGLATSEMDDDGKAAEVELIDEKEISQITDFLSEIGGTSKGQFLKYMAIEKIEDISKPNFAKAIAALEAGLKQKKDKK